MKKVGLLLLAAVLLAVLGKGLLGSKSSEYEPTSSEVPLRADFERAATTRVQPENYQQELLHIERELIQLERVQ